MIHTRTDSSMTSMERAVRERAAARAALKKHRAGKRMPQDDFFHSDREKLLDRRWAAGMRVLQLAVSLVAALISTVSN